MDFYLNFELDVAPPPEKFWLGGSIPTPTPATQSSGKSASFLADVCFACGLGG